MNDPTLLQLDPADSLTVAGQRVTVSQRLTLGHKLAARASLDEVGREVLELPLSVARGTETKSESLGHQEFVLTCKFFEPIGPACLSS